MGPLPRVRSIAFATSLALAAFVAPVSAQADELTAEQLFQEGMAAMKRDDLPVACEAFAKSNQADPSPGTQINLALCFEKRKMWASAWTWYRSAIGAAQQRHQKEREQLAEREANRLKPLIHYLIVTLAEPPPDVVVRRDGVEVVISVGGKEVPLPIDPGDHTIEVSARGKQRWTKSVHVADTPQTERIEVPKLDDAPAAPPPSAPSGAPTPAAETAAGVTDGGGQRTIGMVVGGAGIVAAVAAIGVFALGKSQESAQDEQRALANAATDAGVRNAHSVSAESKGEAADNDRLIAAILGGGALVMLATGAVLYLTASPSGPSAAKPPIGKARIVPQVGPAFAGLALGATF